jgi:hypothetical protein
METARHRLEPGLERHDVRFAIRSDPDRNKRRTGAQDRRSKAGRRAPQKRRVQRKRTKEGDRADKAEGGCGDQVHVLPIWPNESAWMTDVPFLFHLSQAMFQGTRVPLFSFTAVTA